MLFAVVGAMWGLVLVRQRAHAHRLHYLMVALVAFKALTLLSQAGMYQLIRSTGHPEGWNVAFYVFNFLRGILFFTVSHRTPSKSYRQDMLEGCFRMSAAKHLICRLEAHNQERGHIDETKGMRPHVVMHADVLSGL